MASSSALWRIVPILAFVGSAVVITAILVDQDGLEEVLVMGLRSNAAEAEMSGTFDGNDADRPHLPVRLVRVAEDLPQVTDIQAVPGHGHYVAVLQKTGQARLLAPDAGSARPWFTVDVHTRSEMGLLGLAFSPDFEQSGVFYVHHSPPSGDRGVVTRWTCDPKTLEAPKPGPVVLSVGQPYVNHDGGQLQMGPDGHLYVALGDGGSGFDPQGNGQNGKTLLGSILRIAPKADGGYDVPADNPFVGNPAVDDAIFAYGLRNPWRFAFTPDGRIIAGDVGQNEIEEIDLVPAGGNMGWSNMEGRSCLKEPCANQGFTGPVWQYDRRDGSSVTGGVVPTSSGVPGLDGRYVFGDYGSGRLWAADLPAEPGTDIGQPHALGRYPIHPSTFGLDGKGRVYVADLSGGGVYRIVGP